MGERPRLIDMFSGIGAFTLGLQRAGAEPVAFYEIDAFCRDILARHWPGVPIHNDVRNAEFPDADIICGGFPCQDVSRAGKRAGIAGERSGLYRELVRAIRMVRPRRAVLENVAALLGDGMGEVLGDLAESGDCVEWDCVPACALGACHERDRVWIVVHTDSFNGRSRATREDGAEVGNGFDERAATDVAHTDSRRRATRASGEIQSGRSVCDEDRVGSSETSGRPDLEPWSSGGACQSNAAHAASLGCGQGWPGRPPDSFAWVRNEARRNAADPHGARLAFREGLGRDAYEEFTAAQRSRGEDVGQSIWPDEPALSGVDDAIADWAHRTKATGNALDPYIPELIGRAIMDQFATDATLAHIGAGVTGP